MNRSELGRKIREARLAKKMTQSEVVGDFITRNMLSQIESGNAIPSIKTLEYIADVLDIPLNKLMSDEGAEHSEQIDENIASYIDGKNLMLSQRYREAASVFEELSNSHCFLSEEASCLLAKCYYKIAEEEAGSESYQSAVSHLKKACDLASIGLFENRSIRTSSLLLLDSISEKLS